MPGRELTDPGSAPPAPSPADVRLAFVEIERDHPQAAEILRRDKAACEGERFTVGLFREGVQQLERSSSMMQRLEPILERAVDALEAEVEVKRRAVALKERAEVERHEAAVAGRTTALEHVRGVWAAVGKAFENKAVIVAASGAITWLATRLYEGLSAWWLP